MAQQPVREEDDPYFLTRTAEEAQRIDEQHRIVTAVTGLLDPGVPHQQPGLKIADIGTSTARWILDLHESRTAEHSPTTTSDVYVGFDISTLHFPDPKTLPSDINIRLEQHDILKPCPSEFHNSFDISHIRFLVLALTGSLQMKTALANTIAITKLGGWVEWVEFDLSNIRILPYSDDPSDITIAQKWDTVYRTLIDTWEQRGGNWGLASTLPKMFEDGGLVKVHAHRHNWHKDVVDKDSLRSMTRNLLQATRNTSPLVIQKLGGVEAVGVVDAKSAHDVIDQMMKELGCEHGEPLRGYFSVDVWAVIGCKVKA